MNIFGFTFSVVEFTQIAVLLLFLIAYLFSRSIRESYTDNLSRKNIILLSDFVIKHHPRINSLNKLTEANDHVARNRGTEIHWITKYYKGFEENGALPELDRFIAKGAMGWHLLAILMAPFFIIRLFFSEIRENNKYRRQRIVHTEMRKDTVSKTFLLFIPNSLLLFFAALAISSTSNLWWLIIIIPTSIAMICAIVLVLYCVSDQIRWKVYWKNLLLDIMGVAGNKKDHDLFNRALMLKNQIEAEPDIPIPSKVSFYAGALGIIQVLIPWVASLFN